MKERWIEIRFAFLCYDLYQTLRDYVNVTAYLEFIANIAKIDQNVALRLLQKVNQINAIRPSKTEFIIIAKKMNYSNAKICKTLHISMRDFQYLHQNLPKDYYITARCSSEEINNMEKLLNAHEIVTQCGMKGAK